MGEKPSFFTIKASVTYIKKDNCLYQACPNQDCNKKLIDVRCWIVMIHL